jgi:hypothetical protein
MAWHDRWLTDGGRGPRLRASRAQASTGVLAEQHLNGWDATEWCDDVRWRRYTDGCGGVMTAANEGGGRDAPMVLHDEGCLRFAPQQEQGLKVRTAHSAVVRHGVTAVRCLWHGVLGLESFTLTRGVYGTCARGGMAGEVGCHWWHDGNKG